MVFEKDNSTLKPVELRLKIDDTSRHTHAKGYIYIYIYIYIYKGKREERYMFNVWFIFLRFSTLSFCFWIQNILSKLFLYEK